LWPFAGPPLVLDRLLDHRIATGELYELPWIGRGKAIYPHHELKMLPAERRVANDGRKKLIAMGRQNRSLGHGTRDCSNRSTTRKPSERPPRCDGSAGLWITRRMRRRKGKKKLPEGWLQ